jgi:hypothetical protein
MLPNDGPSRRHQLVRETIWVVSTSNPSTITIWAPQRREGDRREREEQVKQMDEDTMPQRRMSGWAYIRPEHWQKRYLAD